MPKNTQNKNKLSGLGKVLIVVYIIWAIAATARSGYQVVREFDKAPLAISLSGLAGLVYIVAAVSLAKRRGVWRKVAWATVVFELIGVLVVGTISVFYPDMIVGSDPQHKIHTVWSFYGGGYGFIPLILPILGMVWLAKQDKNSAELGA